MDIYELRTHNLKTLIGENSIKDFADAFELDASYLSQLLNSHRRMGERAAATIERKMELPTGTISAPEIHIMPAISVQRRFQTKGLKPPTFMKINRSSFQRFYGEILSDEEIAERARLSGLTLEEAMAEDDQAQAEESQGQYGQAHSDVATEELSVVSGSVPVVGKAMLGPEGYFEAIDYPPGVGDGRLMVPSTDPNAYGLKVVGSSMMPRIKNGEYVLIEPNQPYMAGDEVLVKTFDGQAMIKEFMYFRDGYYRFESVNADVEPLIMPAESVEKIHYVAGILRSSRFMPDAD